MSGFGYRNLGFGGGNYVAPTIQPKSLRFDSAGSSVLKRTPGSASNQDTYTWSAWIKRSGTMTAGGYQVLFGSGDTATSSQTSIWIAGDANYWGIYWGGAGGPQHSSSQLLRDPGGWYHLVCAVDMTDATANDRAKLYMNGVRVTAYQEQTEQSQNTDTYINAAAIHGIGGSGESTSAHFFHGYMAEVHFIDGTALTPSTFGEAGDYGEWKPIIAPAGITYGTNGFYLDFALSTADATGIGLDVSGNGNNWTPTNIAATDQSLDSPTNNFATFNSVFKQGMRLADTTLSEGNLQASVATNSFMASTMSPGSGQWYAECYLKTLGSTNGETAVGWIQTDYSQTTAHGSHADCWHVYYSGYSPNHIKIFDETTEGTNVNLTVAAGNIFQWALDIDNLKGWIGINNTWYAADGGTDGNPATGANPTFTFTTAEATDLVNMVGNGTGTDVWVANFGQDSSFAGDETSQNNADSAGYGDFYYAPPSGFLALCTKNLPVPAVIPSAHFNTVIWTGANNTAGRSTTGVGFQPDLVWAKVRDGASNHTLYDAVRGTGANSELDSNDNGAEGASNPDAYDHLSSFDADGFSTTHTGPNTAYYFNHTSYTYVAWNWLAGNATLGTGDFTQGSIASTCSRNAAAGFSIVSYSGDASATADGSNNSGAYWTIGHGLSTAPEVIMVKKRSSAGAWYMGHIGLGSDVWTADRHLVLNTTAAAAATGGSILWGSSTVNSTIFSAGGWDVINRSGSTYIAYCFHSVDGYSKMGSYTGNADVDGPFVYTGFRPAWLMIKNTSATSNWGMHDATRDTYNYTIKRLYADSSSAENGAEAESTYGIDFLSNGFKIRSSHTSTNSDTHTWIYIAFAETPTKYANAR